MGEIEIKENDKSVSVQNQSLETIKIKSQCSALVTQVFNFNGQNNLLKSMNEISIFVNLKVLNLQHNQISKIEGLQKLKQLGALILNNNKIKLIQGLENCLELNTLVLSNNQLSSIDGILHLSKLQRLQLSHNQIVSLENCRCMNLEQLRVNNNKIEEIPQFFSQLNKLKIFDIGKNELKDVNNFLILKDLKLIQLNISGNPCSEKALNIVVKFPRIRQINNIAADKVLETHKSKIPQKIIEKTEKVKQKINKPVVTYDLEEEIVNTPVIQQPKQSVVVKVEKPLNKKNIKQQKRVKKINLEDEPKIEKW